MGIQWAHLPSVLVRAQYAADGHVQVGLTVKANEVLCDTCHGLEGYENCEECGCLICGQQVWIAAA
jgi:hypothetical protein